MFSGLECNTSLHIFTQHLSQQSFTRRAIPKVSNLNALDNNIFRNLYISETLILYLLK